VERLVQQVLERWGRIDILVNNAGIIHPSRLEEISEAQWQTTLAVHLTGTFHCTQTVMPTMKTQGGGKIINVAAPSALRRKPDIADEHLPSVGAAYYLAGKPEEAIAPLKQYLTRYPNILGAHLTLAAVYSELGKEAEARAEAVEILRINPQFSLEVHKQREPIKDPTMLERHFAALRQAGLK
jgi:tetratricopeptide (TPR) repeat protein